MRSPWPRAVVKGQDVLAVLPQLNLYVSDVPNLLFDVNGVERTLLLDPLVCPLQKFEIRLSRDLALGSLDQGAVGSKV